MTELITNLIDALEQRKEIQMKLYEIDNKINQLIVRVKKLEQYK